MFEAGRVRILKKGESHGPRVRVVTGGAQGWTEKAIGKTGREAEKREHRYFEEYHLSHDKQSEGR